MDTEEDDNDSCRDLRDLTHEIDEEEAKELNGPLDEVQASRITDRAVLVAEAKANEPNHKQVTHHKLIVVLHDGA